MVRKFEVGSLILRVVLGIIFFIHGLDKFTAGIEHTVVFFESVGIPGFLAYIVAVFEIVGGLALILGVATRIVSILFILLLIVATFQVKLAFGFLGGYELDLALLAISIYLAITNRSLYAIDNVLFSKKQG